ncbi:MAG TPA: cation:proton antiporter [Kofleriaceae bacterium]|nr:cation:proton antiporter [Kofleriaceae bacterium]
MVEVLLVLALAGLMQAVHGFTTGVAGGGTELAFGYLLLVSFFGARVISRFGLPRLTGYLLAGVISGPFVLGLVSNNMATSLKIVSDVATCILGLTAGGELNLKRIRPYLGTLRAITLFGVVAAMFALAALLFVLRPLLPLFDGLDLTQALAVCGLVGVALSAQSPAVVMALLSEMRSDGPVSRVVLATVVLADLVVVVIYSVVAALAGSVLGGDIDLKETVMTVGWELFGSMGFGVVIGVIIAMFLRYVGKGAAMFALMVCLVVAEIGARVHLDPLVVMLAAGVWLENFSRTDAGKLLRGFESAELPVFLVFFSLAGSRLDIFQLWAMAIPVVLIALARAVVFYVGCRTACARSGADPMVTKYGWTGLVPQAGLSLALVVVIRNSFPTFGPAAAVLLLSVVGVNQLIAPVLLRITLKRSGEAGKRAENVFAAH